MDFVYCGSIVELALSLPSLDIAVGLVTYFM